MFNIFVVKVQKAEKGLKQVFIFILVRQLYLQEKGEIKFAIRRKQQM